MAPPRLRRPARLAAVAAVAALTATAGLLAPGDPLPDPWYGGMDGFETTMAAIERALPHILAEVDD